MHLIRHAGGRRDIREAGAHGEADPSRSPSERAAGPRRRAGTPCPPAGAHPDTLRAPLLRHELICVGWDSSQNKSQPTTTNERELLLQLKKIKTIKRKEKEERKKQNQKKKEKKRKEKEKDQGSNVTRCRRCLFTPSSPDVRRASAAAQSSAVPRRAAQSRPAPLRELSPLPPRPALPLRRDFQSADL